MSRVIQQRAVRAERALSGQQPSEPSDAAECADQCSRAQQANEPKPDDDSGGKDGSSEDGGGDGDGSEGGSVSEQRQRTCSTLGVERWGCWMTQHRRLEILAGFRLDVWKGLSHD